LQVLKIQSTIGYRVVQDWLAAQDFAPFSFQEQCWQAIHDNKNGLVNAPTGCGKTFSVFLGAVIQFINRYPDSFREQKNNGLQLLWVTPLRALAKDIGRAMETAIAGLQLPWRVGIRNGDTEIKERERQKKSMPEVLIITPESLHLLIASKDHAALFHSLRIVAVDEWHELLGSKRGVQTELAVAHLFALRKKAMREIPAHPALLCYGISATIGNLQQAMQILLAPACNPAAAVIIRSHIKKKTTITSIIPQVIEEYPWAGHLGLRMVQQVVPVIWENRTTLIFTNTRGQAELWYQALLQADPNLAGLLALHHGSIDFDLRTWIEDALHEGKLRAVVCTASLDLGVDFRPVDTVIQVGSPKGVARFLQRAGRSGHQPTATSRIYFLPTHSLELLEAAALKAAVKENLIEKREPMLLCYDVLVQYLCTLATGDGFFPEAAWKEISTTHCYAGMTPEDWQQLLQAVTVGGVALQQYDEFKKVEIAENGLYKINSRRVAMRHRMHIGTIVSDAMLKVKFMSGGYIGVIEEYFVSKFTPGDTFTLAGRILEFVMIKEMTVLVRKSNAKKAVTPSWMGGRMPLSTSLGTMLRRTLAEAVTGRSKVIELRVLQSLFALQAELSYIPAANELLIEQITTKDGYHLFVYPFEGRLVHEAMAALLAFRISRMQPITFSLAMNDYGFELLSDQPIPVDDNNVYALFSPENLLQDIQQSVNATEMAKRKFRDISVIGGLVFQGFPGEHKKARHLQASASLLFNVFSTYEPHNLLLRQAYNEVLEQQMEEVRLRGTLTRIQESKIVITYPQKLTPFCFPIKVDSLRENMTSEKLEDRIKRMQTGD
jgi:ATP-dependent helicase Lhr and Lhr-like helicase